MQFLSPIAALIAGGIVIPLLVALYFLKLRRRQVAVPSTLLWRKAIHDLEVNAPFQRLRRNLLLLLQLMILAALLLAFARPTTLDVAPGGQQVVLLIDHSASMNATDVAPTRLEEAKRVALTLIDELSDRGSGGAMVVSFAQQPSMRQPTTTDRALLRQAVRNIEATDQSTLLEPALRLIQSFTQDGQGPNLVAYLISDGRARDLADHLALPGVDLRFIRIGSDNPVNVGIIALSARRALERPQDVQVFARLSNNQAIAVDANVALRVDGQVMQVVRVSIPPASAPTELGTQSVKFDIQSPGLAVVQVSHDVADDLLADNQAWLVVAPPRELRVLLVTPGNAFLRRALHVAEAQEVRVMTPAEYEAIASGQAPGLSVDGYDLVVLDRHVPARLPATSTLSFYAAPPIDGLSLRAGPADGAAQLVLNWDRHHPLMRHVALEDVLLASPGRLVVPDGAAVLATAQSGPIMAELSVNGVPHVTASFDLMQSNWPMQISFPVFIANAVQYLASGGGIEAGYSHRPGESLSVPVVADAGEIYYRSPGATVAGRISGRRAHLPPLRRAGLYTADGPIDAPWDRLAVNMADPVESDLRPAAALEVGAATVRADDRAAQMRREVWRYFVWAALAVLLLEWLVYVRRMHL
jgi:hypothetical protein